MRAAYLDPYSGLSGDMILGAMLDCGLSLDSLTAGLDRLGLSGYRISAQPAMRGAIGGTQLTVELDAGQTQQRGLDDILAVIDGSDIGERVKQRSARIFRRLAEAEARVHRIPVDEVHFHEVGAVDAIVDVVGAAIGLELLGIEKLYSGPLPSGGGTVRTEHGTIPVPAPATLELMATAGAAIRPTPERQVELTTPTGAAIVTALASFERPTLSLERVGYGIGARQTEEVPNVLPLWLGETVEEQDSLLLMETNIDDMSPELYGHVMQLLFQRGALDVWFTPIQMKKERPAVMLSVLAPPEAEGQVVETVLRETSTLGLRVQPVSRHLAAREQVQFDSSLGEVTIKLKRLHGEAIDLSPEYEDCRRLAAGHGLPLREVYRIVTAEASAKLLGR